MRIRGKITFWNTKKRFGFVTSIKGNKRVFIHISAFKNRMRAPEINQEITYSLSKDNQGRQHAKQALYDNDRVQAERGSIKRNLPAITAGIFIAIVGLAVQTHKIPLHVFTLYMAASLLTFVMYALDKRASIRRGWRTKESTLHLCALIGGWPGALIAQQTLQHKSRKQPFRLIFFITSALNIFVFIWLFTSEGTVFLRSLQQHLS